MPLGQTNKKPAILLVLFKLNDVQTNPIGACLLKRPYKDMWKNVLNDSHKMSSSVNKQIWVTNQTAGGFSSS